ncbi:nucleolar protein-like protein NOP52 variant [Phyllosticta capitalensis]
MAEPTSPNSPFIRQLAANDKRIRDKALESLKMFLQSRTEGLDEIELLKLWKGLFFCMWQSDKPLTQQTLARDLAGIVDTLPQALVLPFLAAFWQTMAREWNGIDALRMDKFLYLVRCYLNAGWRHFAARRWRDAPRLSQYLDILRQTPLNPTEPRIPNGLRYHVVDIYIDELDKVDEKREGNMPLEEVLAPLRELGEKSVTKAVRQRVRETLDDEAKKLRNWNTQGEESSEEEGNEGEQDQDEEWGGIDD